PVRGDYPRVTAAGTHSHPTRPCIGAGSRAVEGRPVPTRPRRPYAASDQTRERFGPTRPLCGVSDERFPAGDPLMRASSLFHPSGPTDQIVLAFELEIDRALDLQQRMLFDLGA